MRLALRRSRSQALATLRRWWRRWHQPVQRLLIPCLVLLALYGAWPYAVLWKLNRAVVQDDSAALAALVDLDAVRDEIARRLNKDRPSAIETLSDSFIEWLESGMRQRGAKVLQALVTLDWVHGRLQAKTLPGKGFLPALTYGFFAGPRDFHARIGSRESGPIMVRLHLDGKGWRVTMLYY